MIETNSDLQFLVVFCWVKKCTTAEICVRLVETSGIITASDDASSNLIDCCDDRSESRRTVLKSITWSDAFREVGQIFEDGVVDFRQKLIMYSIETSYKYKCVE